MKNIALVVIGWAIFIFQLNAQIIIPKNSRWSYLGDGSNQGVAWREGTFDDSKWPSGNGQFGFGDGDEATRLTKNSPSLTYYFRKKVRIDIDPSGKRFEFHIVHDDDAIVYVNGVEIFRSALMPAGIVSYTTGTTNFNDKENDYYTYTVDGSKFIQGENTIAIEVHNQNSGSSDVSFDAELVEGSAKTYANDGPYVLYRNGNILVQQILNNRLITNTYPENSHPVITCQVGDGRSFQVPLREQHSIAPDTYPMPDKVLFTSDIEGNMPALVSLLEKAGVINNSLQWTFGKGHLVYQGDMFDRGTQLIECLWLIYKLEAEAAKAGGRVHFILGNHDIMNMINDLRYVDGKYFESAQLMNEPIATIHDSRSEIGRWLRSKNIIEKMGPYLSMHGGLSKQVVDLNLTLKMMNDYGRKKIEGNCTGDCAIVTGGTASGIFWYRDIANQALTQTDVDYILKKMNAEKMFLAHTIVSSSITKIYNNEVYRIDLDHATIFRTNRTMKALLYDNCTFSEIVTSINSNVYNPMETVSNTTLAQSNTSSMVSVPGTGIYPIGGCNQAIGKIENTGASTDVNGNVSAKVWVEHVQPLGFVKRHYEITPEGNASSVTGKITLYYAQEEFNDFNNISVQKLPTNPGNAIGISNFRIIKFDGVSADASGLPGSYAGKHIVINPDDASIIWNAMQNVWEVTIDVTGFSGFFASTEDIALPVSFGNVSANIRNSILQVVWETLSEKDVDHFEIQVSPDGKNFTTIQSVKSKTKNGNTAEKLKYEFVIELSNMALGFSLFIVLLFNLKKRKVGILVVIVASLLLIIGCSKKRDTLVSKNDSLYVRIVQVDKDGDLQYSKVIKAV